MILRKQHRDPAGEWNFILVSNGGDTTYSCGKRSDATTRLPGGVSQHDILSCAGTGGRAPGHRRNARGDLRVEVSREAEIFYSSRLAQRQELERASRQPSSVETNSCFQSRQKSSSYWERHKETLAGGSGQATRPEPMLYRFPEQLAFCEERSARSPGRHVLLGETKRNSHAAAAIRVRSQTRQVRLLSGAFDN